MSAGYIDSAIETLEDMGYFDGMEDSGATDAAELERGRMADKIDHLRGLVIQMRAGLQELYAMRGEDDLVARVCNPLIEATRDF